MEYRVKKEVTVDSIRQDLINHIKEADPERLAELYNEILNIEVYSTDGTDMHYYHGFTQITAMSLQQIANEQFGKNKWSAKQFSTEEELTALAEEHAGLIFIQTDAAFQRTGRTWFVWAIGNKR